MGKVWQKSQCRLNFRGMTLTLSYLVQFSVCVKDGIKYLQLKSFGIKKRKKKK